MSIYVPDKHTLSVDSCDRQMSEQRRYDPKTNEGHCQWNK